MARVRVSNRCRPRRLRLAVDAIGRVCGPGQRVSNRHLGRRRGVKVYIRGPRRRADQRERFDLELFAELSAGLALSLNADTFPEDAPLIIAVRRTGSRPAARLKRHSLWPDLRLVANVLTRRRRKSSCSAPRTTSNRILVDSDNPLLPRSLSSSFRPCHGNNLCAWALQLLAAPFAVGKRWSRRTLYAAIAVLTVL